jgi:Bacterial DNA polymerase III alpha subunit finger domain
MTHNIGDIDIDVTPHTDKGKYGVRAIIHIEEARKIKSHPSGHYVDSNIPVDGVTGMAAIDHKVSDDLGFTKIDLLTNTSYNMFESKQEVIDNLNKKPDWNLLLDPKFIKGLPQIANHMELLREVKPKSIDELADVLALMRPGKMHLLESYLNNREKVRSNLYRKPKNGFIFKRSHAIAYAGLIVCVMNKKLDSRLLRY